jgi:hypothetical protein
MVSAAVRGRLDGGLLATAANSGFNDRVIEAARTSLQEGGREVRLSSPTV